MSIDSGPRLAPATPLPRTPTRRPPHNWWRPVGKTAASLVAVVVLLVVWQVLPAAGVINKGFLPPISTVARTWWHLMREGSLEPNIWASVKRALEGLLASVVVGVPLGLLIGWYRPVAVMLTPLLEIFRNTAPIALLPVFILFLGIGEVSKVAVIFYACVWPVLLNTVSGVQDADPLLVKAGRSLGLGQGAIFGRIVVPAALPAIFSGVRLAGTFSVLMVIIAEQVGATSGLGYYVNNTQQSSQIPEMYAAIVSITLVGLVFNAVLVLIERRVFSWRPKRS